MLFVYPIEATAENWLHDCLYEILCSIHASLQTTKTLPEWPDIIPEPYRKRLHKRKALESKLNTYRKNLEKLTIDEQERILQALHDQNKIALLLSCQLNCEAISDLPQRIRKPVKKLFEYAFDILTDMEIRDKHYKVIYDKVPYHICPFCGCEYFDAPGAPREALDHYLAESKYPFAASNLRNLVPMGTKCNSRYKLAKDILTRDDGTRRQSFDPYNHTGVRISLENSQPFIGTDEKLPQWNIEFDPDTEETTTWDEVFDIRKRYIRDILDPSFNRWLDNFGDLFRKNFGNSPITDQAIVQGIRQHCEDLELMKLTGQDFLRYLVFQMLYKQCHSGNQRLINLIRDVVNKVQTP
ncbi:hypothetical protein [Nostoc sp.]|uniref:hypothetical protein n=1 Tax=Nostoc sp. TaxID=1180 RepID=UPI002FF49660